MIDITKELPPIDKIIIGFHPEWMMINKGEDSSYCCGSGPGYVPWLWDDSYCSKKIRKRLHRDGT